MQIFSSALVILKYLNPFYKFLGKCVLFSKNIHAAAICFFHFQIVTTTTYSILTITKLKLAYSGEYMCRLTNVAGSVESLANLTVVKGADLGVPPDFKQRLNDIRVQQNAVSEFKCVVVGTPEPTTSWFKVR